MEINEALSACVKVLQSKNDTVVVAESCTGGGVAYYLTQLPGSSAWLESGFVTYTNEAKQHLLGVRQRSLNDFGAVSEKVAEEMLAGALKNSNASVGVAITGIAGPEGATPDKPVGTVCFAAQRKGETPMTKTCQFLGEREAIRTQSICEALFLLGAL